MQYMDCKEIQPVHLKGTQSWIFIGRTDVEAETPILWAPNAESWLIIKDPDAGKDWRQEEKGMVEDEIVGWYHWLNGLKFDQTLGYGEGQGSLVCCSPWGHKERRLRDWTTASTTDEKGGASQVAPVVKNLPANVGRRHGTPLQYSCLENPMDRGAWQAIVHRVG